MTLSNNRLKGYLSATFLGVSIAFGAGCSSQQPELDAPNNSQPLASATGSAVIKIVPEAQTTPPDQTQMTPEEEAALMLERVKNNPALQMKYLTEIIQGIRQLHVDETKTQDAEKMISAALNGVLKELDPHSSYMTAKEFKEFSSNMSGEFVGVGVIVDYENKKLTVSEPIENGPADKAGIKAGDVITHVDGKALSGMPQEEAIKVLRGENGTTVTVTVERANSPKPIDVSITRAVVENPPVRSRMIGNDIAYVQLTTFANARAADELRKHITDLQTKNPGLSSVILDLRYNPGGYVHIATQIIDDLLDSDEVTVSMRGRNAKDNREARATPGDITNGRRILVMMNEGSASASELTAAALQDHKRAIVLGTQSFGKGTVQQIMPLPLGDAIKITTGAYFSPLGRSIQNHGITPDILYVAPADPNAPKIRREADMENTLKNSALVQDTSQIKSTCAPIDTKAPVTVPKELQTPRGAKADFELICAVETLRNQSKYTVSAPYVAPAKSAAAPRP